MPQPYLCLFDVLSGPLTDVVSRVESTFAKSDYTFDGVVRKLERRKDGFLYYAIETLDADTWSEGLLRSSSRRWHGLAFECRCRGYDVCVGLLGEPSGTTLVIEYDSVLFYEIERDDGFYRSWLSLLLSVGSTLGVRCASFKKGGPKQAIDFSRFLDGLRAGAMEDSGAPILMLIRADLFSEPEAMALGLKGYDVMATTSGYTVVTSLHVSK